MKIPQYIVAHDRDRDFYQVALALQEHGSLKRLVTDYYHDHDSWVKRHVFSSLLGHRQQTGLPSSAVRDTWAAVAIQAMARGIKPHGKIDWVHYSNRQIGKRALREAIAHPDANLLLYSTVAEESFSSPECEGRKKHLFLYHPHPALITHILKEDFETFGIGKDSLREEVGMGHRVENLNKELSLSDHVICASSLSKRSVEHSNLNSCPVSVVPYGTVHNRIVFDGSEKQKKVPRFLFVGQAIQRKGVHHLLKAWRKLNAPSAELVLVCSRVQDNILRELPNNVVVKKNLSLPELEAEFRSANFFILPSLIEGFGLVLLEALQAGCYTIFSDATGLADYDIPPSIGKLVQAGNVLGLTAAMDQALQLLNGGSIKPLEIANFSRTISMDRFRQGLFDALGTI